MFFTLGDAFSSRAHTAMSQPPPAVQALYMRILVFFFAPLVSTLLHSLLQHTVVAIDFSFLSRVRRQKDGAL